MRRIALALVTIAALSSHAFAQGPAPEAAPGAKPNANPCSDEVSAALQKLRKSSWFRMTTHMLTENGPSEMQVDYVLPDRMHQKVTQKLTGKTTELILVGNEAWSKQDETGWKPLSKQVADQIKGQMQDTVLTQQTDVGKYACKGRVQLDGRDVYSYRLDNEPEKGSTADVNQAYRMFYVDALTGLPVSNTILAPGHEDRPVFKTAYSFPLDLKIEPPKDVVATPPASETPGK
ncbi:hypothetical protein [Hyphomicrobium sp.]|uniref:hypothetical protein n=1 Tax=Hyphomicrobium sp. TaxID=82 RepID=UPI002D7A3990|nr:hypothetical protein [Hyphomicrobium sp.]HET6388201.1 hypothetical protein [Hyphomicrobium sp.]